MDVIMGDIPCITTLCLNGTLSCVNFMDVTMGDVSLAHVQRNTANPLDVSFHLISLNRF